jgi:hypothetical protein
MHGDFNERKTGPGKLLSHRKKGYRQFYNSNVKIMTKMGGIPYHLRHRGKATGRSRIADFSLPRLPLTVLNIYFKSVPIRSIRF